MRFRAIRKFGGCRGPDGAHSCDAERTGLIPRGQDSVVDDGPSQEGDRKGGRGDRSASDGNRLCKEGRQLEGQRQLDIRPAWSRGALRRSIISETVPKKVPGGVEGRSSGAVVTTLKYEKQPRRSATGGGVGRRGPGLRSAEAEMDDEGLPRPRLFGGLAEEVALLFGQVLGDVDVNLDIQVALSIFCLHALVL